MATPAVKHSILFRAVFNFLVIPSFLNGAYSCNLTIFVASAVAMAVPSLRLAKGQGKQKGVAAKGGGKRGKNHRTPDAVENDRVRAAKGKGKHPLDPFLDEPFWACVTDVDKAFWVARGHIKQKVTFNACRDEMETPSRVWKSRQIDVDDAIRDERVRIAKGKGKHPLDPFLDEPFWARVTDVDEAFWVASGQGKQKRYAINARLNVMDESFLANKGKGKQKLASRVPPSNHDSKAVPEGYITCWGCQGTGFQHEGSACVVCLPHHPGALPEDRIKCFMCNGTGKQGGDLCLVCSLRSEPGCLNKEYASARQRCWGCRGTGTQNGDMCVVCLRHDPGTLPHDRRRCPHCGGRGMRR